MDNNIVLKQKPSWREIFPWITIVLGIILLFGCKCKLTDEILINNKAVIKKKSKNLPTGVYIFFGNSCFLAWGEYKDLWNSCQ